jgi:hypothetical protein
MFSKLALALALICIVGGTVLLYKVASSQDPAQTAGLIGGAVLLSLGSVTLTLVTKAWWECRRRSKDGGRSISD